MWNTFSFQNTAWSFGKTWHLPQSPELFRNVKASQLDGLSLWSLFAGLVLLPGWMPFYEWSVKICERNLKTHPKPKFSVFIGELLLIKYMFIVKNTERSNLRSLYRHCFNSCLKKHRVNNNFLKDVYGDRIHHGWGHMASAVRKQRVNRKSGWAIKC